MGGLGGGGGTHACNHVHVCAHGFVSVCLCVSMCVHDEMHAFASFVSTPGTYMIVHHK